MSPSTQHALFLLACGCLSTLFVPSAWGQAQPRDEALKLTLARAEVSDQDDEEKRLLKERYNAAMDEWDSLVGLVEIGQLTPADPQLHDALERLVAAGLELYTLSPGRIKLLEENARISRLADETTEAAAAAGRATRQEQHRSRYYRLHAELLLLREKKRT